MVISAKLVVAYCTTRNICDLDNNQTNTRYWQCCEIRYIYLFLQINCTPCHCPLFLVIPTLNGQLEFLGLSTIAAYFASVGELFVPAIWNIRTKNTGVFSDIQIQKAQSIHAFTYCFYTITFFYLIREMLKDDTFLSIDNNRRLPKAPFKWLDSTIINVLTALIMLTASLACYFGWGMTDCTQPGAFFYHTNCALDDDLLLFINAHFLPLTMVFMISTGFYILGSIPELIEK